VQAGNKLYDQCVDLKVMKFKIFIGMWSYFQKVSLKLKLNF